MALSLTSNGTSARTLAHRAGAALLTLSVIFTGSVCVATPSFAAQAQNQDAPRRLYDRVMDEFRQRDYQAALAGFRFFLELHGKSGLAPSARYWMGECQYRLGQYDQAMDTFSSLISYFPSNPKVSATTLKIAMTHVKLGQPEEARITFQRVVNEWPDSMEADVARKGLAKFDPAGEQIAGALQ